MTTSTVRKGWDNAAVYAQTFGRLCDGTVPALLDGLGPVQGSLLDVGTGPGRLALEASRCGWAVTAVDPEEPMLSIAAATAPAATCLRAALPQLPFDDGAFDAVVASYVVNHLPDPSAGARELARVLRAGGRLGVTIWPAELTAMNRMWEDVVSRARVERPAGLRLPAGADFDRTAEGLDALLDEAGVDSVTVESTWDFSMDAELLWTGVEAGIASIGATYRAQDEAGRAAMHAAYLEIVDETSVDGMLRLPSRALLAHGTRR